MIIRLLLILTILSNTAWSQEKIPSPEEFVNAVFHTVVDSAFSHYYLVKGADSCRFVKYNYDEWVKYALKEPVPFPILNELSEKAYLSRYPYFWKQDNLHKAIGITRHQADSILSSPQRSRNVVYSFSLPQFTDDGQYAIIDLNSICGLTCGQGLTCLFHRTATGWKLIGRYTNWSS